MLICKIDFWTGYSYEIRQLEDAYLDAKYL